MIGIVGNIIEHKESEEYLQKDRSIALNISVRFHHYDPSVVSA